MIHNGPQNIYYGQIDPASNLATDAIIAGYFDQDYVGTCVEVGVADGRKGSNTLHFERRDWETLCIDPIPEHVCEARTLRKLVHEGACVGSIADDCPDFYVFDIGDGHILSSLSGLKPDPKLLVSHGHLINECYTIQVECNSLEAILRQYDFPRDIDFISIDTEGTELDVLRGINFSARNIKLLVVENNYNEPHIENYLACHGYIKVQRHYVNDFYIKETK